MRSKSSADGGTGFEGGAEVAVEEEPNKSVTVGPEVETGGVEKALQSPNSPFPVDEEAAVEVGRLAEAAGEEKSAKPPMRS